MKITTFKQKYNDTLSSPRSMSVKNKLLPNTRTISREIQNDNGQLENNWTHMGNVGS